MMMKMAWNNKLIAYPVVNQKNILKMPDIMRMAQTSIEKLPTDFSFFMRLSWE